MKCFTTLAVTAWLTLAIPPTPLNGDAQQALAQTTTPSCPTLRILAVLPRDRTQWLLLASGTSVTTPVTIELTTEREIATYAVPLVSFAEAIDGSIAYRSTPIVLANPLGTVLSATVRASHDATATCENVKRIVRTPDDVGVYNLAPLSAEDARYNEIVMTETQPPGEPIGAKSRRSVLTPDYKVTHRDAKTVRAVEPDYPDRARRNGDVGTVQIKVSLSETGAVRTASIYHSSGSADLDRAALAAARSSTYAPEVENCFPVAGTYPFRADFSLGGRLR